MTTSRMQIKIRDLESQLTQSSKQLNEYCDQLDEERDTIERGKQMYSEVLA